MMDRESNLVILYDARDGHKSEHPEHNVAGESANAIRKHDGEQLVY